MTTYTPPIADMLYALKHMGGFDDAIAKTGAELDDTLIEAILDEAGKLARDVIAPMNMIGDQKGSHLKNGTVTVPPEFKAAYQQYAQTGWNAVPFPTEFGGQGLLSGISFAIQELWQAGSLAFGLCPLLNQGAIEAILHHASDELKQTYLPKMISGEWTGTMNLTEPQAGSDLSAIRSKAEPEDDHFKISGQKIYITYGEHDMTDNIIHLVLARLPDAPEGVKGISLFIVPKILQDGSKNTLSCVGLEHKLGIHASPTAVMQFDDAVGYLVGEPHKGLKYMFTMMNNARLSVGLQGVAISERAYQQALSYANERVQGFSIGGSRENRAPISEHGDVKRMLLDMRSHIIAMRAMTYAAAVQLDLASTGDEHAQTHVEILTPLVKSWCTDKSIDITSINIQIHGGMGFVEETGAAQLMRDARILPIYEGTNGIQANDLVFRKVLRDGGAGIKSFIEELKIPDNSDLMAAITDLEAATNLILKMGSDNLPAAASICMPYLNLFASVTATAYVARAQKTDGNFPYENELNFLTTHVLSQTSGLLKIIEHGADCILQANFTE